MLSVAGVILAAGEALAKLFEASLWVHALIAIFVAVVGALTAYVGYRSTHAERLRKLAEHLLWPVPRVDEVDPEQLGIRASQIARELAGERPPYVPRDRDAELDHALAANSVVIVTGPSGAGKSRTLYEAVLRAFPRQRILVPKTGASPEELLKLDLPADLDRDPVVLWLDDLERYFGAGGLTLDVLDRLESLGATIHAVATLRSEQREAILRDDQLARPGREVLRSARTAVIVLGRTLQPVERQKAVELYRDDRVVSALASYGIGEFFAAGPELIDRYEDGKATSPVGASIVAAAIDWRRAGLVRPIQREALKAVCPVYLGQLTGSTEVTEDDFEAGEAWARMSIYGTARLLRKRDDGFDVDDYLIEYVQRSGASGPPDELWTLVMNSAAESEEFVAIGVSGYDAGRPTIAVDAWKKAAALGGEGGFLASVSLGFVLSEQAAYAEAEQFLTDALNSSDKDTVALAKLNLGVLRSRQGELTEGEMLFRQGLESGNAVVAPLSAANLGWILVQRGLVQEVEEAERLLQAAIDSANADAAAIGRLNLGLLRMNQGRLQEAEGLFRQGLESGNAVAAPMSAANLGYLLVQRDPVGEAEEAERLLQAAIDSANADAAAIGRLNLGLLRMNQGRLQEAEGLFRQGLESGNAVAAPLSAANLGFILVQRGAVEEAEEAERLLQVAIDSGNANAAVLATLHLGALRVGEGRDAEAKELFRAARDSGHPQAAQAAKAILEQLDADVKAPQVE